MRQWAIAIGINQYQFFQPLIYAKADAQAFRATLVSQGAFAPEQCLLLTDTSPPLDGRSTQPDGEAILGWLDWLYQHHLQPGDRLWVFFSGYGVCHQGQDYLVPIDSNPTAIATTAISVSQLLQRLRSAAIEPLLILDVSRSQGSLSPEMVGAHTAHAAAMVGVPTLLSCEPGQFSHETVALGHGFFTAALLDTLTQRTNLTLGGLEQRLRDRVPQLTEQYYRPAQLPLLICPAVKRDQVIWGAGPVGAVANSRTGYSAQGEVGRNGTGKGRGLTTLTTEQAHGYRGNGHHPSGSYPNGNGSVAIAPMNTLPQQVTGAVSTNGTGVTTASQPPQVNSATVEYGAPGQSYMNGHYHPPMSDQPTHPPASDSQPPATSPVIPNLANPPEADDPPAGGALMWGSIVATALLLATGVYWRNFAALSGRSVAVVPAPIGDRSVPDGDRKTPTTRSTVVKGSGSASLGGASNAIAPSPVVDPPLVIKPVIPQPVNRNPAEPNPVNPKPVNPKPVNPKPVTVKPGNSGKQTVIAGTKQSGSTSVNPKPAGNKPGQVVTPAKPVRTATRLRKEIYSTQASPYWYGIQEARKVKPTDPDYRQAQQDIARWSREIWTIAQWRADQRRYDVAIMAASLVPADQAIHQEAQQAIDRWCPSLSRYRVVNVSQRRQAKAICQRG